MLSENLLDALPLGPGAKSILFSLQAQELQRGEPWNVSNLPTSCPLFWKRLTYRTGFSHPSLASL